jgi:hypothetical protein
MYCATAQQYPSRIRKCSVEGAFRSPVCRLSVLNMDYHGDPAWRDFPRHRTLRT